MLSVCHTDFLSYCRRVLRSPYDSLSCSDTSYCHVWFPHSVHGSSSILRCHGLVSHFPTWSLLYPVYPLVSWTPCCVMCFPGVVAGLRRQRMRCGRRSFCIVTSLFSCRLQIPLLGWWGHRASYTSLLGCSLCGIPPRELTLSIFCYTFSVPPGSVPGSSPSFFHCVACRPIYHSHCRTGPRCSPACILCQRCLRWKSSILRH